MRLTDLSRTLRGGPLIRPVSPHRGDAENAEIERRITITAFSAGSAVACTDR